VLALNWLALALSRSSLLRSLHHRPLITIGMPHNFSCIGTVAMVRWGKELAITDCLALPREIDEARRRAGEPIVFVSIVPADMRVPSAEARQAFSRAVDHMKKECTSVHVVIEGAGFVQATLRSVLTAWNFATRTQHMVTVHASLEQALRVIAETVHIDPNALLSTARFRKLVA
jgi:hypothetical protein